MKFRILTAGALAAMLVASPALAAPPEEKDPQAMASEGVQRLIRAMELMLLSIPQYETPFINENGDIIIRRKNPPKDSSDPGTDSPRKDKSI